MKRYTATFLFYSMISWLIGCVGYMLLFMIIPDGKVFGGVYRMHLYHYRHPYQYILVVALAYGISATIWGQHLGHLTGWKRTVSIVMIMLLALVLASVPGGLLWGIHDIRAGFIPSTDVLFRNLIWAATTGLTSGWIVIVRSLPYNIIGCFVGYLLTHLGQRFLKMKGWG